MCIRDRHHMARTLLLLAICALAAASATPGPYDDIVPEEDMEMVEVAASADIEEEVVSSVDDLRAQFLALKAQLKEDSTITPGVAKTIKKMISMVTTQIEPAIQNAHSSDQSLLNAKAGAIKSINQATKQSHARMHLSLIHI
eukprot:TRINITY_DN577_c0_g1_i1.p1 TRINITY_DN577_c0_g1~~TRINITY_DN577_c0_g1_i1.p1  ORF type:complete len:142 (+),score=81.06 TRINITY_DN577_c0_g1_i1:151-576(+)